MATIEDLEGFAGRGAGTDAERRAARWLADRCSAGGREVVVESFWCRPNWALTHAWHVGLAIVGSLLALVSPIAAIVLLATALGSVVVDAIVGRSLGRRLTPERASQNVTASQPAAGVDDAAGSARLILTANYDAGRTGFAYRLRPATSRLKGTLHGATPGWLGWISLAMLWLLVVAVLREAGQTSHSIGAFQFPPTAGLLVAFALLVELGTGDWSPAAGDNASGVAVLLKVADALAAATPQRLTVDVVLTGAGDADQIGLRRFLRGRRPTRQPGWARRPASGPRAIVVGFADCASGTPAWWQSDGWFLPLRYSASLRRIARRVAEDEPHLRIGSHRGRANSGALAARAAGLASITVGCLEDNGTAPRSHRPNDTSLAVDRQALDRAIQFTLLLVDGIDAAVGEERTRPATTPA